MNTQQKQTAVGFERTDTTPARQFVILSVISFKESYPDFDVNKLSKTSGPNLTNVDLTKKQMAQINLHPVVLSTICGTIFGDSSLSIHKNYKNARLQMRHSTRQTDWFMWKSLYIFKEFIANTGTSFSSICFQKPDGYQRNTESFGGEMLGKWKVLTKADPKLTQIYSIICSSKGQGQGSSLVSSKPDPNPKNTKKTLQRYWLNHMNAYFLMTLWLDDGSLNGARQGVLSLNSTPLDQAEVLVQYIQNVWGIDCKARIVESKKTKSNPQPVAITFSDLNNLEKWLRIIAPIVPVKSMLYKVCIYSEDSSRLQRWTSELKLLVRPEWHQYLDKYYAYLGSIKENKHQKKI